VVGEITGRLIFFLVLLVNDSEYSKSTGAKPILPPSCIYLVSPGALRAPTPPRLPFWGRESTKKPKKREIVGVGEVAVAFCFPGGFGLLEGS
jgi:hypothetical protein